MRLSLLQPRIVRGDIEHNLQTIQRMINECEGDLLVLPEYVLTGSLIHDPNADIHDWARRSAAAKGRLAVPDGKYLLINTLAYLDDGLYNCCELLPTGRRQCKLFPDETELSAGIRPGTEQTVFEVLDKRFRAIICTDLRHMDQIPTDNLDFALWIFHFTGSNYPRAMESVKQLSRERGLRMFVCSLVSDQNIGYSAYIEGEVLIALPHNEGILEVTIV